jgi:hypothetical protein
LETLRAESGSIISTKFVGIPLQTDQEYINAYKALVAKLPGETPLWQRILQVVGGFAMIFVGAYYENPALVFFGVDQIVAGIVGTDLLDIAAQAIATAIGGEKYAQFSIWRPFAQNNNILLSLANFGYSIVLFMALSWGINTLCYRALTPYLSYEDFLRQQVEQRVILKSTSDTLKFVEEQRGLEGELVLPNGAKFSAEARSQALDELESATIKFRDAHIGNPQAIRDLRNLISKLPKTTKPIVRAAMQAEEESVTEDINMALERWQGQAGRITVAPWRSLRVTVGTAPAEIVTVGTTPESRLIAYMERYLSREFFADIEARAAWTQLRNGPNFLVNNYQTFGPTGASSVFTTFGGIGVPGTEAEVMLARLMAHVERPFIRQSLAYFMTSSLFSDLGVTASSGVWANSLLFAQMSPVSSAMDMVLAGTGAGAKVTTFLTDLAATYATLAKLLYGLLRYSGFIEMGLWDLASPGGFTGWVASWFYGRVGYNPYLYTNWQSIFNTLNSV